MPADYQKIRDENIARYGWDTAVLDLLGHLYSERSHFIFELIQNAEDAGATELAFGLFADRLEVRHDGRPFTEADVRGVCGVGVSAKAGDLTAIGRFGIGFKSVYAYTAAPQVHSGSEHFRIENYVRPAQAEPLDLQPGETVFVFPFDLPDVPAGTAVAEISAALRDLDPVTLLFLRRIGRLRVTGGIAGPVTVERTAASRTPSSQRVTLRRQRDGDRPAAADWIVWHRDTGGPVQTSGAGGRRVEIAFAVSAAGGRDQLIRLDDAPLAVFFPTQKQTSLGFLIQGPYRTTPARDNVPEHDPANLSLAGQTAALLADVLRELRDEGLLTPVVLQALPLDAARFAEGTLLRSLFESVKSAVAADRLVPVRPGSYATAETVLLTHDAGLRELLTPAQLGQLRGAGGPVQFADAAITAAGAPLLWRYLTTEIGIRELTAESAVSLLTSEFLTAQPDAWIAGLHSFLDGRPSLWQPPGESGGAAAAGGSDAVARHRPIIRLEDGTQTEPFGPDGRPAAYLPGPAPSSLPTVRRAVAADPAARRFLAALGLTEPDVVAEVLDGILPRYRELALADLDPVQHSADVEAVAVALAQAAGDTRQQLVGRLAETAFLIGENAATGEQRLLPPGSLYQRSRQLEVYFDGNERSFFAADTYGPWLPQLRAMGVRESPELRARRPDPLGYVVLVDEFARHERGTGGFDPGAQLDGLQFALRNPTAARSEYVWNALLVPNAHLASGIVETSVRDAFVDAERGEARSALGAVAAAEAWLPGPDGTFRQPAEIRLDQLPASYTPDETLAAALGMAQSVVAEAARQLGLTADLLRGLSERPDLIELIERELGQSAGVSGR